MVDHQRIAAEWNTLGRRLRTAIDARLGRNGVSELERRLKARGVSGGSRSMLLRYLGNDVSPTADFVVAVSRELQINPGWLLTGAGVMYEQTGEKDIETVEFVQQRCIATFYLRHFPNHRLHEVFADGIGFRMLEALAADIYRMRTIKEVVGPWQVTEDVLEAVFAPMLRSAPFRRLQPRVDDAAAVNTYLSAVCGAVYALYDLSVWGGLAEFDIETANETLEHDESVAAALRSDFERLRALPDPVEAATRRWTFPVGDGTSVVTTIGPGYVDCECDDFTPGGYYCHHLRAAAQQVWDDELASAERQAEEAALSYQIPTDLREMERELHARRMRARSGGFDPAPYELRPGGPPPSTEPLPPPAPPLTAEESRERFEEEQRELNALRGPMVSHNQVAATE